MNFALGQNSLEKEMIDMIQADEVMKELGISVGIGMSKIIPMWPENILIRH